MKETEKLDAPEIPPCSHDYNPEPIPYHLRRRMAEECRESLKKEIDELPDYGVNDHKEEILDNILRIIRGEP
jgi:hypothetical protein